MSIILYVSIVLIVAMIIFIISKFDKEKTTRDAINGIK